MCYVNFSSVGVSVSNLFRFNEMGCNKKGLKMVIFKLLFLSDMHTYLYVSFYHTNSINMFYIVHKYKKRLESGYMDLTHSQILIFTSFCS